jgi:hypothetical protein
MFVVMMRNGNEKAEWGFCDGQLYPTQKAAEITAKAMRATIANFNLTLEVTVRELCEIKKTKRHKTKKSA